MSLPSPPLSSFIPSMPGRRLRTVWIDSRVLMQMFGGHPMRSMTSDWPTDARIVGGSWDETRDRLRLVIESASFDEVPPGYTIMDWLPTFQVTTAAPLLVSLMEREQREMELDTALDKTT